MADWQDFERLGEQIYKELSPHATVTWNDHIYGHTSEIDRQIDVSIRWNDEHGEYLIAVQMKDESTKADVNTVGTFASVLRDIRADRGILVTRAGVTRTAQVYARKLGIELHGLHDAQSVKWNRELTIPILWIDLKPVLRPCIMARFDANDSISILDVHQLCQDESTGYKLLGISESFVSAWNSGMLPRDIDVEHGIVSPEGPLFIRALRPDGNIEWRELKQFRLTYVVERQCWLGRFKPAECRGIVDVTNGENFVISHLPIGELPITRDDRWEQIDSPEGTAARIRGSLVTSEGYEVDGSSATWDGVQGIYLGP